MEISGESPLPSIYWKCWTVRLRRGNVCEFRVCLGSVSRFSSRGPRRSLLWRDSLSVVQTEWGRLVYFFSSQSCMCLQLPSASCWNKKLRLSLKRHTSWLCCAQLWVFQQVPASSVRFRCHELRWIISKSIFNNQPDRDGRWTCQKFHNERLD